MTFFASFHPNSIRRMQDVLSPLAFRLLRRLTLCLFSTLVFGALLAHYALPSIARLCAMGEPAGLAEVALLYIWFRSLADMWRYAAWDLFHLTATRRNREKLSVQSVTTNGPEI